MTFIIIFILLACVAHYANEAEAEARRETTDRLDRERIRKARGLKPWESDNMPDTFPEDWSKR